MTGFICRSTFLFFCLRINIALNSPVLIFLQMDSTAQATVLIHGYGFDPRIWQPVELAFEGHKTIYLSLPGFGKEPVTAGYTIEELAINYWKYLDGLNINQVNLVGHSMGGYVCLEMLAKQSSRVSSFALIHSHVYADSEEKKSSRSGVMLDIKTNGRMGVGQQTHTLSCR